MSDAERPKTIYDQRRRAQDAANALAALRVDCPDCVVVAKFCVKHVDAWTTVSERISTLEARAKDAEAALVKYKERVASALHLQMEAVLDPAVNDKSALLDRAQKAEARVAELTRELSNWPIVTATHANGHLLPEPVTIRLGQRDVDEAFKDVAAARAERDEAKRVARAALEMVQPAFRHLRTCTAESAAAAARAERDEAVGLLRWWFARDGHPPVKMTEAYLARLTAPQEAKKGPTT